MSSASQSRTLFNVFGFLPTKLASGLARTAVILAELMTLGSAREMTMPRTFEALASEKRRAVRSSGVRAFVVRGRSWRSTTPLAMGDVIDVEKRLDVSQLVTTLVSQLSGYRETRADAGRRVREGSMRVSEVSIG